VRFKPDLDYRLVSFSVLTLLVWSSGLLIVVPDMPYNVLSATLRLYTTRTAAVIQFSLAALQRLTNGQLVFYAD